MTDPTPHRIAEGDLQAIIESYGDNPQNVGDEDNQDPFGDLVIEFAHVLGLGDDATDEQYQRLDQAMVESEATTMRALAEEVEEAFALRSRA